MEFAPSIRRRGESRRPARGIASLAVTLIMLALSALVVLYANRGQLFEQRASANQMRATMAFEAAEAGIEWALARLNDPDPIVSASNCMTGGPGAVPFGDIYAPKSSDPANPNNLTMFDVTPPTNSRAACAIAEGSGVLTCSCPTPANPPAAFNLAAPERRSFSVEYGDFIPDAGVVTITSVGCRDATVGGAPSICNSQAGTNHEGRTTITILAKFVPGAKTVANAALTTGGAAAVCGSANITNTNTFAGGYLVNSGNNTQVGNSTYTSGPLPAGMQNCGGGPGQIMTTMPGTPISAAIRPNDAALAAAAATTDSMMKAYLGMTLAEYQASPTCEINGTSASDRANQVLARYSSGECTRFWINGDVQFSAVTLGTQGRPVIIASANDMTFNGNSEIWGIVYSDIDFMWSHNGTGTATVHGQVIVRGNYYANGNITIDYDGGVLRNTLRTSGEFVKVPGSWREVF